MSRFSISPTLLAFPIFYLYKKSRTAFTASLLLLMATMSGCFINLYKTNRVNSADSAMIENLQNRQKVFIIHYKEGVSGIENMSVNNNMIAGTIVTPDNAHLQHLKPSKAKPNRLKKGFQEEALMEVHLYTDEKKPDNGNLSLPLSAFNRVDVYEYNKSATTAARVLTITGIVAAVAVTAFLVAFLIACNCPQVYVADNGQYDFHGGLYSGAVYKSLERTDYMPIGSWDSQQQKLQMRIENATGEEQFINSVQLLRVEHAPGASALVDRHGKVFLVSNPLPPHSAIAPGLGDVLDKVAKEDQQAYSFNSAVAKKNFSNVVLTFGKPAEAQKATMIISGRNSDWSGYIYKEFNGLFGESFEKWQQQQDQADPAMLEAWQKNQALPLMVYVKDGNKWKHVDYFSMTGNTASRKMIMELKLPPTSEKTISIKLETVYRFWDLDYAAIDLSESDADITTTYIDASTALTHDGTDKREELREKDKKYCYLTGSEAIDFEFLPLKKIDKKITSFFLVSSGYYHKLENGIGKAKTMELLKFRQPGAFDAFSKNKYQEANNQLKKYAVNSRKQ